MTSGAGAALLLTSHPRSFAPSAAATVIGSTLGPIAGRDSSGRGKKIRRS